MDSSSPQAKAPVHVRVDNGERVILHVAKNMFHTCTATTKLEALPAFPNPIAQVLAMLSGIPGIETVLRQETEPPPPHVPPEAAPLQRQLEDLRQDVARLNADLDESVMQIRDRATSLPEWVACDRTAVCSDASAARAKLDQLAQAIQRTPSSPIGSTVMVAARTSELLKMLTGRIAEASDKESAWLQWAFARIRTIQELIDAAIERRQTAIKGREALLALRERILAFTPAEAFEEPLPPQENAKAIVTISCVNVVTQQPVVYANAGGDAPRERRIVPLTVSVAYQSVRRATVSGGVLYSLVGRRAIGIAAHRVGVDDAGVVAYQRRIVESGRAAWELVPFSFFNVLIPGLRAGPMTVAASLGVGLNPNNGATVAEYFAGGSIGIGPAVSVQIGAHLGTRLEPAEQFTVGDVLPDRLSAVPTTRTRARALGIGLSYTLPLPR